MITGNEPAMGFGYEKSIDNPSYGRGSSVEYFKKSIEYKGLTIRQHFAAMAMQGFCSAGYGDFNSNHVEAIAKFSVEQADALIAELNKPTQND